ncbi:MAG TPA: homoserine dehydrogenase [Methylomirabilota bacterium]|nr:homoserine dehydrogenase [Methylomirabilota bacterium]
MQQVNLGIIGGGTVGGGVFQAIQRNGPLIASRLGVKLKIVRMAVRDPNKKRAVRIPASLLTSDWAAVVNDPSVNLIVELMGGTTTAREVALQAFKQGKPVVTANKALLSAHGEELFAASERSGTNLYYEASVAGGIPIIKVLRESLVGNRITHLYGIVNGTCNFILSRMKQDDAGFDETLADAQQQGFAETEPTLDIDGWDALHKIGILASLAHGFWVNPAKIHLQGIRGLDRLDVRFAEWLGYTIKLLGVVKKSEAALRKKPRPGAFSPIQVSVCPTLIPNAHVLASVNHVFNAVFIRGDIVGDTLYYGRGAGQDATASAVLSDLADAALDLKFGSKNRIPPFVPHEREGAVLPMDEVVSRYYVRLSVIDRPGTLAKIAAILGRARIGISSVIQPEGHEGASVPLILMIHDATRASMVKALREIGRLPVIRGRPVMYPVESFE